MTSGWIYVMAKNILNIGDFTILRRLGIGARSSIYLATDQQDKSKVALKRVIFEEVTDLRIFEQVENEFKVAQKIDHPYIRKCYKLKKIRKMFKVKELLLSMEFIDAETLEKSPPLSLIDILLVFRMVAGGLNAMHHRGLIHCDIKPNNIMLSKSGSIKIIDLGQCCKTGTIKQRIQGTPDYIAPEQVKREPLGPKTDIFNMGATMYWALTGENVPTLIPKKNKIGSPVQQQRQCKPPHKLKKQIPVGVSKLVMDCVKEDTTERPRNMSMVISRLDLLIHSILGDKIKTNQ